MESAIDNVFKSLSGNEIKVEGVIKMFSDHDGLTIDINFQNAKIINKLITKKSRCFSNEIIKTFLYYFTRENWIEVFRAFPKKNLKLFTTTISIFHLKLKIPRQF